MRIANNRALVAEKKTYEIPGVEMVQLAMSSIICVSGGDELQNSGKGSSEIPEGGSIIIGS